MGTDSWAISTSVREAMPIRNEYLYRKIRERMLVFLTNGIRVNIFAGPKNPTAARPKSFRIKSEF